MNVIGVQVNLTISEPWKSYKELTGIITELHLIQWKSFVKYRDDLSTIDFILTNRYLGDDVSDVVTGKTIIVGISIYENEVMSLDDAINSSSMKYVGIGSLKLLKNSSSEGKSR